MSMRATRLVAAVLFAVLADYLLFEHLLGTGLAVFALALGAVAVFRYGRRMRRALPWLALWVIVALGAALQKSAVGFAVLLLLGWAVLALARSPQGESLLSGVARGMVGASRTFAGPFAVLKRWLGSGRVLRRGNRPVWVALVPAVVIVVFAVIMVPANIVLADWVGTLFQYLRSFVEQLSAKRVFLWAIVGVHVFGILMFRPLRARIRRAFDGASDAAAPDAGHAAPAVRNELAAAVVTFAGLNLLYLAMNATDAAYLWFALKLPKGFTYAEYAHRGSYRLMAAAVLAALTVAAFFRIRALASSNRLTRTLALVFVAQNLIVLLGALRRLELYVEVYGLTRFRVAAFLWMLLVCAGFALVTVKVARKRPFVFLLRANAVSVAVLLALVSVLDLNGFIARWNVAWFEEGRAAAMDVGYLATLGPSALPSLARLAASGAPGVSETAARSLDVLLSRVRKTDYCWQACTLRGRLAVREALAISQGGGGARPARAGEAAFTAAGSRTASAAPFEEIAR